MTEAKLLRIIASLAAICADLLEREETKTPPKVKTLRDFEPKEEVWDTNTHVYIADREGEPIAPKEYARQYYPANVRCTLCGKVGKNRRTCLADFYIVHHPDLILHPVPRTDAIGNPNLMHEAGYRWTDRDHREAISLKGN